jgi:RNA polymerase sigma factor (sigma-70 family)
VEASALQAPVGFARLSLSAPLLRLRSDEQLVALFRAGNEEAFRVIHDRYGPRLFAYARQMLAGSRQDAEDAIQDVFVRAYSSLRANDRPIALRAWLYRVAHNRCIDHLRRPVPPSADVFDVSRAPIADPLAEAERREDLKRLVEDVRRLPTQQRSVLLMRELEGLPYSELAEAMDVSVAAVKSLLVRARMGLVESAEARDTECSEIRHDLSIAHGRGVRANGRARRHLRDCEGCREYRSELRRVQKSFAALTPVAGPLGLLAKLGLGGGGGGATAGGGAVVGGGAAATGGLTAGGSIAGAAGAALTATKVAVVVSAVVVAGGSAVKVEQKVAEQIQEQSAPVVAPASVRPAEPISERAAKAVEAPAQVAPPTVVPVEVPATDGTAPAAEPTQSAAVTDEATNDQSAGNGGLAAPDDSSDAQAPTDPAKAVGDTNPLVQPLENAHSGSGSNSGSGSGSGSSTGNGSGSSGSGSGTATGTKQP